MIEFLVREVTVPFWNLLFLSLVGIIAGLIMNNKG